MAKGATSKSKTKNEENRKREEEQQRQQANQKRAESKPQRTQTAENKPTTQEAAPKPTSTQIPTLEPKYASAEQIEEARNVGRRSLEMARSGQLKDEAPFSYGVRGIAEQYDIPKLEEAPSTTMPSNEYAPQTHQERTGKGYRPSPEEVPTYNKNAYKSEQRDAQNSEGPVDILGTRRPNSISEEGQRQVDKLNRRIESLQNTPMTGDAAIDEVTQRNNQDEIAKLQRQIDTIYNTDNSDNESNVERYLDPNYKLSKYEEQNAEQIFGEYLENNPKAKELYNTTDAAMSSLLAQRFTPEEAEEYARMVTLKNKTSDLSSAGLHMAQSMPFVKGLADKSTEKYGERIGRDLSDYDYSSQLEQTQRQNPLASTAGNMGYQLGSYAAFAPLVEGIPVVGKAASALGGKFSNPAVAKAVESIVSGQAADTILDTLPNEVLPDIMEGNWRDLPKDILLNQAGNLAFNVAGEGIGALARNFIPSLRQTDEVADAVKQNELDPVDLARQNEIDVNAKVDNVNQAVDEINRLDEQIPEAPAQPIEQAVRNTPDVENSASNIIPATTRENYVPHSRQGEAPTFDMPEYRADYSKGIAENVKSLEMPNDVRGYVDSKVKTLDDIFGRIDNAQTKEELDGLYKELNDTVKDLDDTLKDSAQARLIPKGSFDDDTKSFVNAINGITINVPENVRAELPDQTLKQLEARLHFYGDGQNINVHLRKNSGIGIDSVFEDIDAATGHALTSFMEKQGLNPAVTENQLKGILEYADYLKETQNSTKVMDYTGGIFDDYVLEAKRRLNARSQALFDVRKPTNNASTTAAENALTAPDFPKVEDANNVPPDVPGSNIPEGSGELVERGMSRHVRAEDTPMKVDNISDEVKADFVDEPDMYKRLTNKETKEKADAIYNGDGDVETQFRTLLSQHDPAALPLGHQIAQDYSAAGNHEMAAQIYRDMGEQLTKSGQFSQAAVLTMMKNDPLTALQYAQRQLDSINEQGAKRFGDKWKDLNLTDEEIQAFNSITPGDQEAIKALYDKIGARLGKEYPTTFMEKLLEGRKVAMLFNVRTNVRNVGANIPTLGMRWVSDRVAAVGEGIAHIINPNFARTQALTGSGITGRRLANDIFNSDAVQAMIKGQNGKYEVPELKNALMNERQMFKGTPVSKWINRVTNGGIERINKKLFGKEGVESGLETIRNATYKALDLGDSPFVKENFIERLGSYIHAQGIKSVDDVPDEAIQTAWEEAMKATYKDDSWAVKMLRGIKGGIEQIPGVGRPISQAVIPFLQAPGNIAARMVDYSPVNATKGVVDIISGATRGSEQAVRRGIDEAAKGLTGTGMIILGMRLKESGILTGDYSEDKDQRNFQKQNGFKPWALHIGDKYFTYDWAQPFAEPMIIGTLLQDAIDNSDQYDSDILNYFGIDNDTADTVIGATKEGVKASVNSWFNASPLQGLADLMSGDYSGSTDIAQNLFNVGVADFAGAFVPSLVNAAAKTNDITQRNTYDPSSQFATFLNQQAAKIPGLSDNLPAKYNTWGEEMEYAGSKGEAAAQRFVVPGEYGIDSNDSVDIEINRLFNDTADAKVFPWTAANKVGDHKLNNREVSEYQRDMGQRSREIVEAFMNSSGYQSMDDASRVEALNTIYSTSKLITERDLFGKEISDNSTYKKAIEAYDQGGAEGFMNFLQGKSLKDEANVSSGSKIAEVIQEAVDTGNIEQAQQIVDNTVTLQSLGLDKPGPAYTYDHAQSIIPGLTVEQFAETYQSIDADGNQGIKQGEIIDYLNANNISSIEGGRLWNAYGNSTWKKIPVLGDDGVWSLKAK